MTRRRIHVTTVDWGWELVSKRSVGRLRWKVLTSTLIAVMSGLKNSPFGKRLRASHQESDEDAIHAAAYSRRTRPRVNSLFAPLPINPALSNDAPTTAAAHALDSDAFDLPLHNPHRIQVKDYGDRFVPSRDAGDMRTSYHLKEEGGGPATPSKHRMIPTESDALKGTVLRHIPPCVQMILSNALMHRRTS